MEDVEAKALFERVGWFYQAADAASTREGIRAIQAYGDRRAREALEQAQSLLEYLAPAFPVLQTMLLTGSLRMGAEKARQMQQEIDVFLASVPSLIPKEPRP